MTGYANIWKDLCYLWLSSMTTIARQHRELRVTDHQHIDNSMQLVVIVSAVMKL